MGVTKQCEIDMKGNAEVIVTLPANNTSIIIIKDIPPVDNLLPFDVYTKDAGRGEENIFLLHDVVYNHCIKPKDCISYPPDQCIPVPICPHYWVRGVFINKLSVHAADYLGDALRIHISNPLDRPVDMIFRSPYGNLKRGILGHYVGCDD